MKSEDRIVEILSEMLIQNDKTNTKLDQVVNRLEKLEQQQAKTNIEFSDVRLALMKIADKLEVTTEHGERITRLEDKVFH